MLVRDLDEELAQLRARARRALGRVVKFDPSQERDELGRWTDGGGGGAIDKDEVEVKTHANVAAATARAKTEGREVPKAHDDVKPTRQEKQP